MYTVIENLYTIAGKNTGIPVRDLKRLVSMYGSDESEWKKMSGHVNSAVYRFEIHWYECDDHIVREPKIKNIKAMKGQ